MDAEDKNGWMWNTFNKLNDKTVDCNLLDSKFQYCFSHLYWKTLNF